jgi:hypothetical protein
MTGQLLELLTAEWDESETDGYLRIRRLITMLEAAAADKLGGVDRNRLFEDDGYLSTASWLRDRAGDSGGQAAQRVREARGLRRHSKVAEAFASATIDRTRVRLLLQAAEVSEELFERDEQVLVDTVASLAVKEAHRAIEYWKQAADQRAAAEDAEHLHQRRRLHVSETLGGMVRIDGELDPEGGQVLLTALDSLTDPMNLDPDDGRTPPQRRADALVDICSDHLTHAQTPTSKTVRPHINVVVGLDALMGEPGGLCELDPGTVITPEAARRLLCDSTVTRIITGPNSEPLDVGRATRTVPPAMRRALNFRDQHCQWAGCDRHWRWCDAHHLQHWVDHGPTSLENLILLCRRHHRMVHEGGEDPPRAPRRQRTLASSRIGPRTQRSLQTAGPPGRRRPV